MPYINVNVTQPLTPEKRIELKRTIAGIIGILPGKTEQTLMIQMEDCKTLYFKGELLENGAYIDVRIYGTCAFEQKEAFTRALFSVFECIMGVQKNDMYVTVSEFDTWGTHGGLK